MRLWPRRHGTSLDLLVVGLGNPGREHARNRHNVGWLVVDELARRHGGSWRGKFDGQLAEIRIDGHKVALLKPETYMNESGKSVRAAAAFFKTDAGLRARRARRGRPRHGPPAGSPRRRARRVTTACARSRSTSARPTSCGCVSASAGPGRGDQRRLADYVLADFEPHDDAERLVALRGRRRRDARRRGTRSRAARRQRQTLVTTSTRASHRPACSANAHRTACPDRSARLTAP